MAITSSLPWHACMHACMHHHWAPLPPYPAPPFPQISGLWIILGSALGFGILASFYGIYHHHVKGGDPLTAGIHDEGGIVDGSDEMLAYEERERGGGTDGGGGKVVDDYEDGGGGGKMVGLPTGAELSKLQSSRAVSGQQGLLDSSGSYCPRSLAVIAAATTAVHVGDGSDDAEVALRGAKQPSIDSDGCGSAGVITPELLPTSREADGAMAAIPPIYGGRSGLMNGEQMRMSVSGSSSVRGGARTLSGRPMGVPPAGGPALSQQASWRKLSTFARDLAGKVRPYLV